MSRILKDSAHANVNIKHMKRTILTILTIFHTRNVKTIGRCFYIYKVQLYSIIVLFTFS